MAIAVIDIGKTNIKALLFAANGRLLGERSAPNRSLDGPPYRHFDEPAIWQFILEGLTELNRLAPIWTISVTTHGAAGALIDETGLVLPLMDYEERAVDEIEAEYAPFRPPFGESMSPPMSGGLNLGRQVFFQAQRFPEAFARAKHLLALPQYWTWRLTGMLAGEATSLACHTDLWAPAQGGPSSMAKALGFDRLIPPLRPAYAPLGPLSENLRAETGLSETVMVLTGIHDSNASLALQLSGRQAPFTVISTGTWIVLLSVGGDLTRLDPAADMMANIDATGRPVACAKFMGGREFSAIAGADPAKARLDHARMVMEAGILALPAFSDQGGPYVGHKGKIVGADLADHALRTALASLYCALIADDQLTRLDAKGPIILDGNFAKNDIFCAALAAFRHGQPLEASAEAVGTAKGAAALAVWPNVFGERAVRLVPARNIRRYQEYRAQWRAALSSMLSHA